ncbi:GSCOCG00008595001-RA-CDS [Cotesia congregata]|uniref:Similar to dnaJ: Chaperone protein DnaJ (Geobacillus thermodenitrificans (Strain NG80-2)) n=1 Tax=Cotesia congregata TaxID=51543 RepID=A0A8J2H5R1_COTCN|nr:GSCOCG00008595001-RA-CDS [Cotesia congregata]CAG5075507.1 Similar to dnaJ: Chaperone protein DnaJ (Geobacillus thermodenitrificans (strain NG80-2)) [Cotesia congregata]
MAHLSIRRWFLKFYGKRQFSSKGRNHYESLEINSKATQGEIKKAYYKLSKQYHPDINKSQEAPVKFRDVAEAYEVLGNYEKRKQYDRTIKVRSPTYHKRENIKPADISKEAHRAHIEILRHRVQHDGNPIYDFDAWTKAHYGETLEKSRKNKEIWRKYRELKKERIETSISKSTETAFLVLFIITTFSFLTFGLLLPSTDDTISPDFVNIKNISSDDSSKKPSDST